LQALNIIFLFNIQTFALFIFHKFRQKQTEKVCGIIYISITDF